MSPEPRPGLTTVVFDLGNVLLDWDPRRLFRRLIEDAGELDHFLSEICTPDWHNLQDRGRPTDVATAELQALHPEQAKLIGAFYSRWPEMTAGALPATVDVLRELREAGVRLLALTNWPAQTFAAARDRFPFFAWFEGIVVSGEEGTAKPDAEIFQRLLIRYDVDPASAAYIDDTAVHVDTARGLGMTAFRFTDAAQLRRDLATAGLPVRSDVGVRPGTVADVPELTAIYNHYVASTAVTFDLTPFSVEERTQGWFDHYAATGPHRLLVATIEDTVVGYATSSEFRPKRAYAPSIEVTVYLGPAAGGRGVGSMLYQELFAALRTEDLHRAYAAISLPNAASVALHRRFGFRDVGVLREVGRKLDAWWDVLYMEKDLP